MSNNYVCEYVSPIGLLHLVSDGEALTELWIEGQRYAEKSGIKGEKRDNLSILILRDNGWMCISAVEIRVIHRLLT